MPESDCVYFVYWFISFSIKVIHDLSFKSPVVLKDLSLHWHLGTILWRGAWFHFHFKCKEKDCENGETASLHTENQGSGVSIVFEGKRHEEREFSRHLECPLVSSHTERYFSLVSHLSALKNRRSNTAGTKLVNVSGAIGNIKKWNLFNSESRSSNSRELAYNSTQSTRSVYRTFFLIAALLVMLRKICVWPWQAKKEKGWKTYRLLRARATSYLSFLPS